MRQDSCAAICLILSDLHPAEQLWGLTPKKATLRDQPEGHDRCHAIGAIWPLGLAQGASALVFGYSRNSVFVQPPNTGVLRCAQDDGVFFAGEGAVRSVW